MKTVTIQIGNTDDKLTQKEWSRYVREMEGQIHYRAHQIHFAARSDGAETWQNAAWVFTIDSHEVSPLRDDLMAVRLYYRQDSIAWTEGETQFV